MTVRAIAMVAAGLLGLVLAAVLGYAALQLISQPIGTSTVPVRGGDQLVGHRSKPSSAARSQAQSKPRTQSPSRTPTPAVTPTQQPDGDAVVRGDSKPDDHGGHGSDDHGGDGHGGDGHDEDDD
jgi:hypothetical protein